MWPRDFPTYTRKINDQNSFTNPQHPPLTSWKQICRCLAHTTKKKKDDESKRGNSTAENENKMDDKGL